MSIWRQCTDLRAFVRWLVGTEELGHILSRSLGRAAPALVPAERSRDVRAGRRR